MACRILVPWAGIKPVSPALEDRFLTTGPQGNPQKGIFKEGSCLIWQKARFWNRFPRIRKLCVITLRLCHSSNKCIPKLTAVLREKPSASRGEVKVPQLCLSLCNPMAYADHGIVQVKILECVAFPFTRGYSQSRDRTQVSHIAAVFFTSWATREALLVGGGGVLVVVTFILFCK